MGDWDELSLDDILRIIEHEIHKLGLATRTLRGVGGDDIAHEVLLKLLEKGNLVKLGNDYVAAGVNESFIRTVAKNKYIDTYRKGRSQFSLDSRSSEDANRTIDIPDERVDENMQIGWLDGEKLIDDADNFLPEKLKVALRALEDTRWDMDQAAKKLKVSAKTMANLTAKIRLHLKTYQSVKGGNFNKSSHPLEPHWNAAEKILQDKTCSQFREIETVRGFLHEFPLPETVEFLGKIAADNPDAALRNRILLVLADNFQTTPLKGLRYALRAAQGAEVTLGNRDIYISHIGFATLSWRAKRINDTLDGIARAMQQGPLKWPLERLHHTVIDATFFHLFMGLVIAARHHPNKLHLFRQEIEQLLGKQYQPKRTSQTWEKRAFHDYQAFAANGRLSTLMSCEIKLEGVLSQMMAMRVVELMFKRRLRQRGSVPEPLSRY